jgi:hypothetical protein
MTFRLVHSLTATPLTATSRCCGLLAKAITCIVNADIVRTQ